MVDLLISGRFLFSFFVATIMFYLMRSIQSQSGQKTGQKLPTRRASSLVDDKNKGLLCLR